MLKKQNHPNNFNIHSQTLTTLKGGLKMLKKPLLPFLILILIISSQLQSALIFEDTFDGPNFDPRWTIHESPRENTGDPSHPVKMDIYNGMARSYSRSNWFCFISTDMNPSLMEVMQVDIKSDTKPVGSNCPSLVMYIDDDNYIQMGLHANSDFTYIYYAKKINGSATTNSWVAKIDDWTTIRFEQLRDTNGNITQMKVYYKNSSGEMVLHDVFDVPESWKSTTHAMFIIGKGGTKYRTGFSNWESDYYNDSGSLKYAYYDNARLEAVPEPSTIGLILMGLFGLLKKK